MQFHTIYTEKNVDKSVPAVKVLPNFHKLSDMLHGAIATPFNANATAILHIFNS